MAVLLASLWIAPSICHAQKNKDMAKQKTWTYTYLRAKENEKQNLKHFIVSNWFAMDSIAVNQGLFNDYKLLENQSKDASSDWDFIVAVEYFTAGTYIDIQEEWQEIRNNHKTILIDGKGLRDLGNIIKSEELIDSFTKTKPNKCIGERMDLIKPFLGTWHEYLVIGTEEEQKPYGKLEISINDNGCSITKEFQHLQQPFTYSTLGFFHTAKSKWIETYTFSNGAYAIYQWDQHGDDFILNIVQSAFNHDGLRRNRWKVINEDLFQIIVEQSEDNGKTWQIGSTTNMKRID